MVEMEGWMGQGWVGRKVSRIVWRSVAVPQRPASPSPTQLSPTLAQGHRFTSLTLIVGRGDTADTQSIVPPPRSPRGKVGLFALVRGVCAGSLAQEIR